MGIGNSQEWFGQRQRNRSTPFGYGSQGGKKRRRGFFRRWQLAPTTETVLPGRTLPSTYQPLYGSCAGGPNYAYSSVQPPFLPISYNNYAAPSYMPPQAMMMQPQRISPFMVPPSPSIGMPMSSPYVQPPYNNIGGVGGRFYPSSYPSAPMRLLTDWTGGGQISPGFLGPPI